MTNFAHAIWQLLIIFMMFSSVTVLTFVTLTFTSKSASLLHMQKCSYSVRIDHALVVGVMSLTFILHISWARVWLSVTCSSILSTRERHSLFLLGLWDTVTAIKVNEAQRSVLHSTIKPALPGALYTGKQSHTKFCCYAMFYCRTIQQIKT